MIAPIMDVQPHDRRLSSTAVFHFLSSTVDSATIDEG